MPFWVSPGLWKSDIAREIWLSSNKLPGVLDFHGCSRCYSCIAEIPSSRLRHSFPKARSLAADSSPLSSSLKLPWAKWSCLVPGYAPSTGAATFNEWFGRGHKTLAPLRLWNQDNYERPFQLQELPLKLAEASFATSSCSTFPLNIPASCTGHSVCSWEHATIHLLHAKLRVAGLFLENCI